MSKSQNQNIAAFKKVEKLFKENSLAFGFSEKIKQFRPNLIKIMLCIRQIHLIYKILKRYNIWLLQELLFFLLVVNISNYEICVWQINGWNKERIYSIYVWVNCKEASMCNIWEITLTINRNIQICDITLWKFPHNKQKENQQQWFSYRKLLG